MAEQISVVPIGNFSCRLCPVVNNNHLKWLVCGEILNISFTLDRSFICPQKIKLQSYLHYLQSYNGLGTFGNPIGLLGKAPRH